MLYILFADGDGYHYSRCQLIATFFDINIKTKI